MKKTTRHVSAWVEHVNGHTPVRASTQEWAIKKHLYSTNDVVARRNLGRVLAQRCLEAGIEYMVCGLTKEELKAEGVSDTILKTSSYFLLPYHKMMQN